MTKTLNKSLSILASGLLLSTLSACNTHATNSSAITSLASNAFGPTANMQGSQAAWINNNDVLLASESKGLIMLNKQTQQATVLASGNYEALASTPINNTTWLIATIDNNQDNVVIFQLDKNTNQWQLTELTRINSPKSQPDTVCLFNNKTTQTVSAFIPDARGLITETIIYDTANNKKTNAPLREFTGISESAGCAVSPQTNTLYISESDIGIWAINANAESKADKKPVLLSAPFGTLSTEIGALSITNDGVLWFTSTQNNQLHAYTPDTKKLANWQLSGDLSLESAAINYTQNNSASAILYDDQTGHYIQSTVPVSPFKQQTLNQYNNTTHLLANVQTTPVRAFGDAADDPAIWINSKEPAKSLILGTDKRRGLMVYNLDGDLEQSLEVGRLNNVDIRQNSTINNAMHTFIAASNRTYNSISILTVGQNNQLKYLNDISTNLTEIYGLCMYSSATGNYVFVNDKSGLYQQYKLIEKNHKVTGKLVREFSLPSQPEGCSADDQHAQLFAGEEDAGIWFIGAEPSDGSNAVKIQNTDEHLVDDVEGMEIYQTNSVRFLVVSSQGDNSYVLYKITNSSDAPSLTFAGKFNIVNNLSSGIDGTSETDGLTVTATPLPGYPEGILVVQDGYNRLPQQPQNFKIVDWRRVKKALK